MISTTAPGLAETVIETLRTHEAELRLMGFRGLSLFGSVARGENRAGSDIDLAAEFDPGAGIGLFALGALKRRLSSMLGLRVDLLAEPVEAPRLKRRIEQDRLRAF